MKAIQGSSPYLTFDGGKTKARSTKDLTSITLSDGRKYTIDDAKATEANPIVMVNNGDDFSTLTYAMDFNSEAIFLSNITNPAYHYWGDDDGDGDATIDTFGNAGDITTGRLSRVITDRWGSLFGRKTALGWCNGAPYKMELITDDGVLSTKYGSPNVSTFTKATAKYYFVPNSPPLMCYVKPFEGSYAVAGPEEQWDAKNKRYIKISTTSYASNFPTTGFNKAYFDLDMGGTGEVTFQPVTSGGITATVVNLPFDSSIKGTNGQKVRVTLTGPAPTQAQIDAATAPTLKKPNLPAQFELIGVDNNGREVIKYGFVLKQWFVKRGVKSTYSEAETWCESAGYRIPHVKELSNGACLDPENQKCTGLQPGTPTSSEKWAMRAIGAGVISEWSDLNIDGETGDNKLIPTAVIFASDLNENNLQASVSLSGMIGALTTSSQQTVCVTP